MENATKDPGEEVVFDIRRFTSDWGPHVVRPWPIPDKPQKPEKPPIPAKKIPVRLWVQTKYFGIHGAILLVCPASQAKPEGCDEVMELHQSEDGSYYVEVQ